MKTRSVTTVRQSRALRSFYSSELNKKLDVRVINETNNYKHFIVVESNSFDDNNSVHLIAEASVRDSFLSIAIYGDAKKKATNLKVELKNQINNTNSNSLQFSH